MTAAAELFLVLTENLVLTYLFGLPGLLKSDCQPRRLLRIGVLTACFIFAGCMLLAWIRPILPAESAHLWIPLCAALINGLLDVLLLLLFAALLGRKSHALIPEIHTAACSSAVLGALLLSFEKNDTVQTACSFGLRSAFGYVLAAMMLCGAAPVLRSEKMPSAVRGWRGMMIYAGLLAMAAACISAGTAAS